MISHFFIDRPIFATVVSVLITLTGAIALLSLPIAQYPQITPPSIQVMITYPGASAQVVADTVAAPIEQEVNGVEGMLYMSSQMGNDGSYQLSVTFDVGTNLNTALVMVQNRVSLAMPKLPIEVQKQGIQIRKRTPDILMVISVYSPHRTYDALYLSNFATINVIDELLRVDGVSDARTFGGRDYSIRVWLNPQKMASCGLNASDVATAIAKQSIDAPAGQVGQSPAPRGQAFQIPVDTLGRLTEPEQFGEIIVKAAGGGAAKSATPTSSASGASIASTATSASATMGQTTAGVLLAGMAASPGGAGSVPVTVGGATTGGGATSGGGATTPGGALGSQAPAAPAAPAASASTANGILTNAVMGRGPQAPAVGIVRLRDVGHVELGGASYVQAYTFDRQPGVGVAVFQLPGTNALDVADRVLAKMKELKARFPDDIEYNPAYNITPFIRESVKDVVYTLFEAVILVGLVVLLFLQNWRSVLIPMIAVPVAIVGTFAVMAAVGFSLNNISLFGLVLAIGIVVDDAIVVVENVERWLEHGLAARDAARRAMEEVTGPVIAVALVLCAVFVPCAFISGITGRFFTQFAVTIAVSTVFSAINSLTLSPALAAILLKPHHARHDPITWLLKHTLGGFFRLFNAGFGASVSAYAWAVGKLLRVNVLVLLAYAALLVWTNSLFQHAPRGFVPQQDQGRIYCHVQLPDSASLQRTREAMAKIEKIILETPGVAHVQTVAGYSFPLAANGPNFGSMFVNLDPFDKRRSPSLRDTEIIGKLRGALFQQVKEAQVQMFSAPPIPGLSVVGGFKIMVEQVGLDLNTLGRQTDALVSELSDRKKHPGLVDVSTQFRAKTPQLYLDIDRSKAYALGVSLAEADQTLAIYLGSLYVNSFNVFGRHWQVNVQAEGDYRNRPSDINLLQVRNNRGQMVPLGTLTALREQSGPVFVNRYNLYTAASISGGLRPGVSSGEVIADVDRVSAATLPLSMKTDWTELMFMQIRAGDTTLFVFGFAVVCVFLALAALYESWSLPLAVILAVPLCLLWSLAGVLMAGDSVNIFVQIGLVVLVGLACKNSILIVEFARRLHQQGQPRWEATKEASRLRLRPILMTSLSFILGVVPLVIATGAGSEMRRSLGTAVFSGMIGVTVFGVFLTPVFFYVIQGISEMRVFTSIATQWIGSILMGGLLGAACGYFLGHLGAAQTQWAMAVGAAAGILAALVLPALHRRIGRK